MSDPVINLLIIVTAVLLLGIASYHDIKTRLVSDLIWICMISSGSVLHILQLIFTLNTSNGAQDYLFNLFLNLVIALILGLVLTLSALGGEADRIAFFAIVFVTPLQSPIFPITNPEYAYIFSFLPKILGVFFNAYLLAIVVPISIFFYNIAQKRRNQDKYDFKNSSGLKSIFLLFVGYPKSTSNIMKIVENKPWHFDFLEIFEEDEWKIHFHMQLDTPEADLKRKLKIAELLENDEKKVVWVQPSLPFISFIFIGFILEIFVGNIILSIMSFIL